MTGRLEVKVWQELVIWQIPYQVFSQMSSPSFYQSYKVAIVIIILILLVETLRLKGKKKAQLLNGSFVGFQSLPPSWEREKEGDTTDIGEIECIALGR